jgi:hypothetical protein
VRADRRRSGGQRGGDDPRQRGANGIRRPRWRYRRARLRLPGARQRALNRIEYALVTEDPGLGLRFAFFDRMTRHEAIPLTEQVQGRLQQFVRRGALLPLLAVSLAAMLTAGLLLSGPGQACQTGTNAAAHVSSPGRAAHCQPDPAIRLDTIPMH